MLNTTQHFKRLSLKTQFNIVREQFLTHELVDLTWNEIKYKLNKYFQIHRSDKNKNAHAIFLYLLNHGSPQLDTIARDLNLSIKTVYRHIHELEREGFLVIGKLYKPGFEHPVNTYKYWGFEDRELIKRVVGVLKAIARGVAHIKGRASELANRIKRASKKYIERGKYFRDVLEIRRLQQMSSQSNFYKNKRNKKNSFKNLSEEEEVDLSISFKTPQRIAMENEINRRNIERTLRESIEIEKRSKELYEEFLNEEVDSDYDEGEWDNIIKQAFTPT